MTRYKKRYRRRKPSLKYQFNIVNSIIGRLFYFGVVVSLIVWLYVIALV